MKAMMVGFAAIIVISVGAYIVMGEVGQTSQQANSGNAVRLD